MTSQTPPPEFRTAIADIVTAAMAYGAMLGINGRDRIEELLRADLSQSLGDALAPEVENLLDIRPSLAEAVYTAAQPHDTEGPVMTHTIGWPKVRRESGLIERKCPHGIGHPDPDSVAAMEPCETAVALAVTTGEGQHVAREVFTADGIPFVRCSCSTAKSPTSSRWLAEHVPNGGVAELQAVVKRQAEGAKA